MITSSFSAFVILREGELSKTKNQHVLGMALLKVLGLDFIRIKREGDGHYTFEAWTIPETEHNGSGKKVVKRGSLSLK